MNVELKCKVMSLAAEARIIRRHENKAKANIRWCRENGKEEQADVFASQRDKLSDHRRGVVRYETRHSLLAYGFLRGTSYLRIEQKCHTPPNWERVLKMAERFGGGTYDNEFKAWREATLPMAA